MQNRLYQKVWFIEHAKLLNTESGSLIFDGQAYTGKQPHEVVEMGTGEELMDNEHLRKAYLGI